MKKPAPLLPALFMVFLLITSAQAQHDFRRGYVVTNSNDTLWGQIDYAPIQLNSVMCNFRPDSTSPVKIYSASGLKGYSLVPGRRCLSKNIRIGNSSALHFVECVIMGHVNLYYLKKPRHEYYFLEQNNKMYELKNERITDVEGGVTYSKESEEYKLLLLDLLKDAPEISSQLERTNYSRKSLTELIVKYHELINKPSEYTIYKTDKTTRKKK
jgi:hypothetical protein